MPKEVIPGPLVRDKYGRMATIKKLLANLLKNLTVQ